MHSPPQSLLRVFLLPVLWVFVIPAAGLAFTTTYISRWSPQMHAASQVSTAQMLAVKTPAQRAALQAQIQHAADAASPNITGLGVTFERVIVDQCDGIFGFFSQPKSVLFGPSTCQEMLQFVWVKWIALGLMLMTGGVFFYVLCLWAWARRSAAWQHLAFRLGWWGMKGFGLVHVIGQGVVLLFLSFWVTALWFEVYVVKLIFIVAVVVLFVMAMAIRALFAKDNIVHTEHGVRLERTQAPAFFAQMEAMAHAANISPPEHVILGIDDKFFVTESPFLLTHAQHLEPVEGRTLYMSLPLMRVLEKKEIEAILAHEFGHFLAGDTTTQRKLNIVYQRFLAYMARMSESVNLGVGYCMNAFHALFEGAIGHHSRQAEFAADSLAAGLVGEKPAGMALLKFVAYTSYRTQTEQDLLDAMDQDQDLHIEQRVRQGFLAFLSAPQTRESMLGQSAPHPFDSHPPLRERLVQMGVDPNLPGVFESPDWGEVPERTWWHEIQDVQEVEAALWKEYEDAFRSEHELLIAYRLMPSSSEDLAKLEVHFPSQTFVAKKEKHPDLVLNWEGIAYQGGPNIMFDTIKKIKRQNSNFQGQMLVLKLQNGKKEKVFLKRLALPEMIFIAEFVRYWERYQVAHSYLAENAE